MGIDSQNTPGPNNSSPKKAIRIEANADFKEHLLLLFKQLGILPLAKLH